MNKCRLGVALSATATLCISLSAAAQDEKWPGGFPGSKMAIETPLKRIISGTPSAYNSNMRSKYGAGSLTSDSASSKFGRKVKAGYVAWHNDMQTALEESRKSRKPVLVFQMLGRLDQEFC